MNCIAKQILFPRLRLLDRINYDMSYSAILQAMGLFLDSTKSLPRGFGNDEVNETT